MNDDYAAEVEAMFAELEDRAAPDFAQVDFNAFITSIHRLDGKIDRMVVRLMNVNDLRAKRGLPPI